ncbi:MAG: GNAT family N-acetyltransferase [Deltaproteobacteria bacterium]|nr:GNAT family N-acetyltransferase [Deltaproteobacteria bacterium]
MSKPIKPLTIRPVAGERIYLRRLLVTDVAEDYLAWLRDDEVVSYLELRFAHHTLESLRHYVIGGMAARDKLLLGIFLKDQDRHIGNISLNWIDWNHYWADVGIMIGDKTCWRQGLGTESVGLIKETAFGSLGLHRLAAGIYSNNVGCIKAFSRAGFEPEARLVGKRLHRSVFVDEIWMSCFNPEFDLKDAHS